MALTLKNTPNFSSAINGTNNIHLFSLVPFKTGTRDGYFIKAHFQTPMTIITRILKIILRVKRFGPKMRHEDVFFTK